MTTAFAAALADEVVQRLEAGAVLGAIDFHADKVQEAGTTLKAFCPIHQDSRFRSLLVDAERGAFRCTIKTCQGYGGGSLLELYALSKNISYVAAAFELVERLQLELGPDWQTQLAESYLQETSAAIDHGDFTEAETLLRELLSVMPELPDARLMLASVMADLGNPEAAAEEYVRLIDYLLTSGKISEASTAAEDAILRFPDNEDLLFIRVRIAEQSENDELAVARMCEILTLRENANRQLDNIGLLEQLVAKAPDKPEFALKLAALYEQQHNMRGASRQYENAARQLIKSGQKGEGIELLEKVVQFNSENTRARLDLARELAEFGNLDSARIHTLRVINQQIDQQEFGPAISTVNGWLEREPESVEMRELMARVYQEQADVPQAAKYLLEGANLAAKAGDHSRSADLLLRAKFITPDDPALRRRLIAEFRGTEEHQRAAFEIIDLAEILFSSDETDAATELLSEGVQMDVSLPLKLQMVSALANHGVTEAALQAIIKLNDTTTDDTPADEVAELREVFVRLVPDNVAYRIEHLQALWAVSPERAVEVAVESAESFLTRDEVFEAIQILEEAAQRLESFVPATGQLIELAERCDRVDLAGLIYQVSIQGFAEQDTETALKYARRIAELDPAHPSAQSDIAYLLAMLGRTAEAAQQYAEVATLLREAGDLENALQYAREGAALNPQNIPALAAQALAARELLSPEETAEMAELLLATTNASSEGSDVARGYLAYADLYPGDEELLPKAIERLKTMDWPEGLARLQARQAAHLSSAGKLKESQQLLGEALESVPDLPEILEQYGQTALANGDNDAASAALARAASAYKANGFANEAAQCAMQAFEAGPSFLSTWETLFRGAEAAGLSRIAVQSAERLSRAYVETGPQSSAARWAREWVRLSPEDPAAHDFLGTALLSIDQKDSATASLSTSARLYLEAGDFASSLAVLKRAADADIFSENDFAILSSLESTVSEQLLKTEARLLLATAEVSRGNLAAARQLAKGMSAQVEAARAWSRIARADVNAESAQTSFLEAARVLHHFGSNSDAIKELQAAVALGQPGYDIQLLLATLLDDAQRYDEALPWQLAVVEKLAKEQSRSLQPLLIHLRSVFAESVDALTRLGKTLFAAGQPDEAVKDLETAATLASQSNNAAALVAICGVDEALTRQSIVLTRARADSLMGMENEQQALEWVQTSGRDLLRAGKADEAIEMAQRWISLAPDDRNAYRLNADAYIAAGEVEGAAHAKLKIALLAFDAGDLDEALREVGPLLENRTATAAALRLKANILKAQSQQDDAADALKDLSDFLLEEGAIDEALEALQESLSLKPGNASALRSQADALRQTQGIVAALPVYRQWVEVLKASADAEQLVVHLNDLRALAPDSVWVLRELTNALTDQGRYSDAAPHLEHLSFVLETEGDYLNAAQVLEMVFSRGTGADAKQLVAIADLYEKAARPSQAQDHLRRAAILHVDANSTNDAVPLVARVIKLSGNEVLPEDYALAAKVYSLSGNTDTAVEHIGKALGLISRVSGNKVRREGILAQALEIAPLNPDYILQHMEMLPAGRAMTEGLRKARELNSAGKPEDSIRVLTQVIALAPHDMSLRQELFDPLRQTGNTNRLRQELTTLASDAIAAGDPDAATEALDEAHTLAQTAAQYRVLAELNERARRTDVAAVNFTEAAMKFAEEGKMESAVANINRAISAKPSAVPAEILAELIKIVGEPILDVAREQLRSALTARRQKQSQALAIALLETVTPERQPEILKTVNSLGGSTFAVGISRQWVNQLLDLNDVPAAEDYASNLLEIAPDSPDAWQLAAKVFLPAGKPADTRRCAVEAARLFQMAGAVIEEEDSYRIALEAEPDNLTVQATLAEYLVREHREDEAVEVLQRVVASAEASGNADMFLEYLNRAVQVAPGNTDLREKLATELQQFAPDSAVENWLEVAQLYNQQGQLEWATRVYKHVLKLNPANETALQNLMHYAEASNDLVAAARYTSALASLKASRKSVGEACRILQAYLERDPDNLEILEQLASLSGMSNNAEVFAATTRALAQKHQKSGNYAEAVRHYELLLERNPKEPRVLMALLDCSAAAGLPEKGAAYARELLGIAKDTEDPERVRLAAATILNYDDYDAAAHNDLGEALLSLNRVPEAVAEWMRAAELFELHANVAAAYTCYRRVTQVNPGTMQAWKRLSDLALNIGDVETARMAVLHVIEKSPGAKEAPKHVALMERLLVALPADKQIHEVALTLYSATKKLDKAAEEYLWLAQNAVAAGQEQRAEELLDEALKLAPDDTRLKSARYDLIRKMGRLEELQLRLRSEATNFEAAGDISQAISVVKELVATAPGQIAVHRDLARLLEAAGKFDDALDQHLQVVRLQLQKGELEEAREIAEELAEKNPKDSRARERIADVLAESSSPDAAARHYMAAARIAEKAKDIDRAIDLYSKAAQARPSWGDARSALATACDKAGRDDRAFDAWIALTAILLDEGDFSQATATLDRLAKGRPDSPEVRVQLAALYEKTGNRTKQAEVLQELVKLHEAAGRGEDALEIYRKLASIYPDDPAILTRYVELLAEQGAKAEDLATEYARLADILAKNGDVEAALQTYEQVLGVNPENTAARSRYAAFLLGRGSRHRALTEMRALSSLYMDRGEPSAAVAVLNAALTISPRDADLCLALAAAQEASGMTEDARVSYARASAILASTAAVKGIDTYRRILSQDENNTAVRLRLVELLINAGDRMEAAREARILAEIHINRGELVEAEKAYRFVDQCEPESIDEIKAAIRRDSYDPSLQYVHYVRLGNTQFDCGDVDAALDAYRTARSLHDDQPEIIQKCIECVSLIAPEAEAIPDYLLMAEKLLLAGDMHKARQTYEKVRQIDPFNNDARCGIESVNAAERSKSSPEPAHDDMILKASKMVSKRVALRDLLIACQEASQAPAADDSQRLGR